MSARRLGLSPVAGARSRQRAVKLALGIDAAEFDRAVAHRPGALFGFLQPDRLADQHLAEEHQLAVPLDLAVGAYPADLVAVGILGLAQVPAVGPRRRIVAVGRGGLAERLVRALFVEIRSEEHTSELQSLMRISYAVFCLKK